MIPGQVTLGFIPIARTTFDMELANDVTRRLRAALDGAGYHLVGPEELVTDLEQAQFAAESVAASHPDLVVMVQASFADSTMAMVIANCIDVPLMLWAIPEAHTGGRLRLNSLCGINLAGHALARAGRKYEYIYADPDDAKGLDKLNIYARAARVRALLKQTRIGRVGENPAGFESCLVNYEQLQEQFGVGVVQIDLQDRLFPEMRQVEAAAVDTAMASLRGRVTGLDTVDAAATRGTLSAYIAFRKLAGHERLKGFAVRCWPEFFTEMGCAACGAVSLLSDEMIPASCEADVNGLLTQLILQNLSDAPAFGSDIVSIDDEANALALWHCGQAPLAMADPDQVPGVTIHSNRKQPLLMDFTLKPGPVTVARLSESGGAFRLVVGHGQIVRGIKSFSGTTGLLRFDRAARDVLDTILREGLEHHISITYGDHVAALLALAQMLNLAVLHL